jgi:hypothetical protein
VGSGSLQTVEALEARQADHSVDAMTDHPALTNDAPMGASQRRAREFRVDMTAWPFPTLIDRVLDRYMEWREATSAVADTYGWWCVAPAGEEATRFAAYVAALDQEETAAGMCAESISEFQRWLPDARSERGF